MNTDVPLEYAIFQLSPRRTRCELFVSGEGKTEKLASGFIKPFVSHLRILKEQISGAVHSIKLDAGGKKNPAAWFSKGTFERFVRFVSTPEVLELVNTLDIEMSELEGARKRYSPVAGDQSADESEVKVAAATDATKKELLRAIDVRLIALKQDLATATARTAAAGFSIKSVSDLLLFADQFGAFRLREACDKFLSLHQRRPELISDEHSLLSAAITPQWKSFDDGFVHSSSGSDMSIDQPEVNQTGPFRLTTDRHEAQMSSPSTHIQQKVSSEPLENSENIKENSAPSVAPPDPVQRAGGASQRLSVQDRINLFEGKQKEQSASSKIVSGSYGDIFLGKLAGAKGEYRRNPSETSMEKLVLRRWSGASDMSIDLSNNSNNNNDQNESADTTGTVTLSVNSLQTDSRKDEMESSSLIESSKCYSLPTSTNNLSEITTFSSSQYKDRKFTREEIQNRDSAYREGIASISVETPRFTSEKEHADTLVHSSNSLDSTRVGTQHDQVVSHRRTRDFSDPGVGVGPQEPATCQKNSCPVLEELVPQNRPRASALALPNGSNQPSFFTQPMDQKDADGVVGQIQATYVPKFKVNISKKEDTVDKLKHALASEKQLKDSMSKVQVASAKAGFVRPHKVTSFEEHNAKQTNFATSHLLLKDSSDLKQVPASQGLRFPGKASDTGQKGRRGGTVPIDGRSVPEFSNSKTNEGKETSPSSSLNESRIANLNNGELNDVLQMKADELERLFAEHKLRVHGDHVASTQRSKTFDDYASKSIVNEPAPSPTKQILEKRLLRNASSNGVEFNSAFMTSNMNMITKHTPDDSKGKLYGTYMQKRDARLREECGSKRAQKEATMKAMHDSLEHSEAEMKVRFAQFSSGQNLTHVHRRAEKMRSFNSRSTPKSKIQTSEILAGDGYEDEEELSESSARNQTKMFLSKKTSSSTSQTSVSPTPKHLVKSSNSGSLGRRVQSENHVTVANFLDPKIENIKPMVVSKSTARAQLRSLTRSKSSIEDAETAKEESYWSNSTRKISASPNRLKDLSLLNSKENFNKVQISSELKQHLKKGNVAHHGPGAIEVKLRNFTVSGELKCQVKSDEIVIQHEDSLDIVDAYDDMDEGSADGENPHTHCDGKISRHGQMYAEPQSESDNVGALFHGGDSTMNSSKFESSINTQGLLEEGSESWNSLVHPSLPYTQEASDIDASMDSLTDSPASWNSHILNQMMDSEAARMRKKWGNAQIPVIAASSYHQSRRDVTKGIKRLLKFGRKNRGTDYLVNDWVSASTASEGEDDPEDGRDYILPPSDDLRKSRMGYTINAYDGFDDGSIFPERTQFLHSSIPTPPANFRLEDDHVSGSSMKGHRSFFSLPSFRSKASQSKPR